VREKVVDPQGKNEKKGAEKGRARKNFRRTASRQKASAAKSVGGGFFRKYAGTRRFMQLVVGAKT